MFEDYGKEYVFEKGKNYRVIDLPSINSLGIPMAFFVGSHDLISNQIDGRWTRDKFMGQNGSLIFYQEFTGGHGTFLFGKDASIYTEYMMPLINEVHEIG